MAERTVYLFLRRLSFIFSFSGIKQFKAKYAYAWEPRYLIYRHVLDLPKLGLALSSVSELGRRRSFGAIESQTWESQFGRRA